MIEDALRRIDLDQWSSNFSFVEFVSTWEVSNANGLLLLYRNCEVCVPGDVCLVANLDLIEHSPIGDTSAVFPSVRTSEGASCISSSCCRIDLFGAGQAFLPE